MRAVADISLISIFDTEHRVLMAHAQRLQEQVNGLTERCHQLEKELARAQGTDAGEGPSHTLPDSITTVSEGLGSLSIGFHGQAKYHGETSSSEVSVGRGYVFLGNVH